MKIRKLLLVTLCFSPLAAFAQVPTLESSKAFADAEVKRLESAIANAAKDPDLLPCDFRELTIQLKYNQWFTDSAHYQALVEMSSGIDATIASINQRLKSLESETVNVLVVQGSDAKSTEIPVAFKDLIDFFKLYETRMSKCPKDQKADLIDLMENEPSANPLKIVLSQIRTAGGMMSVNLNASLQETNATYELLMTPKDYGYNLDLRVIINIGESKETYVFSLLKDASSNEIRLDEKAKWDMLSKAKIDGMPIDGLLRYRQIQNEYKGKCETLTNIPSRRYGAPYVKYEEIPKIAKNIGKGDYAPADMTFVRIEAGSFQMGSPSTETGRDDDEVRHSVTLTKAFEMQTTEITQAQWFEVMKTNPSHFKSKNDCPQTWSDEMDPVGMCPKNPVENVSWKDVQRFIKKVNTLNDEYIYRLPTEAEWEYAARGRTSTPYFTSNGNLEKVAWYRRGLTHEVASLKDAANAYGLYDMHGNVWEWVQDHYTPYEKTSEKDPLGSSGKNRVRRGGGWDNDLNKLRSAYRGPMSPKANDYSTGARLVRTAK